MNRVGQQICDHLRSPVRVERAARVALDAQLDGAAGVEHLHVVDHLLADGLEVRLVRRERNAAATVGARIVEQVVHHALDALRVGDDAPELPLLLLVGRAPLQQLRGGENDAQQVAQVVAQDAEDAVAVASRGSPAPTGPSPGNPPAARTRSASPSKSASATESTEAVVSRNASSVRGRSDSMSWLTSAALDMRSSARSVRSRASV